MRREWLSGFDGVGGNLADGCAEPASGGVDREAGEDDNRAEEETVHA